jgi:bifunctional non-homologous end joining protein LigD
MTKGGFVKPMLATLADAPFDDGAWVFETKWDGYRVIARTAPGHVTLYSRNGLDVTSTYPAIAEALGACRKPMLVDGELVALDEGGVARFQLIQQAKREPQRLRYCVFDLLELDGKSLCALSLLVRKDKLRAALPRSRALLFSAHIEGAGIAAFKAAEKSDLEGIIGKRADSLYYPGRRSADWVKIKSGMRQEAVIVGFTAPKRTREHFGALALAVRDDTAAGARTKKAWRFVGHVGTGFSVDDLARIYARLEPLIQKTAVVAAPGLNPRLTTWVKPELVCEVRFSEWTGDDQMRHPVFMGLRDDKPASRVVQEAPRRAPATTKRSAGRSKR